MAAPNPFPDFDPITSFRAGMRKGPPWQSIVDFATHPSFCGLRLYPRQMTLLKLIYLETEQMTQYDFDVIEGWRTGFKNRAQPMGVQPDIWYRVQYLKDNGYTHFPHVQMVMGRRASKGILGGIVICERMAYLYSLDSWQQHFEQMPGQIAEVQVVATSLAQAVTRQFKDVRNTVIGCEYLKHHIIGDKITEFAIRTPGDERYIEEMRLARMSTDREIATITCKASTSASTSGRGGTGLVNAYDEFAHMISGTGSGKTGEEIYDAFQPSLDQFGSVALTYLASSPYCLAPETKVLTDDWRWVPVGSLSVGDKLVGFDEELPGGRGSYRAWRQTEVTETSVIQAPRYELTMESGKKIIGTGEHMWLTKRAGGMGRGKGRGLRSESFSQNWCWTKIKDLQPGDAIKTIGTDPWETDESRGGGYLAGFFDGEGHLSVNNTQAGLGYTQNRGPVLDKVNALLAERGYETRDNTLDTKLAKCYITGGFPAIMRFLGSIRPERLLPKFNDRFYGSRISGRSAAVDRVVSMEFKDHGPVVALGTSTSTLVAEGLLSHNTQIGKFYELYKHGSVTMEEYNREEGKLQTQSFAEQAAAQDIDADEAGGAHVAEPTYLIAQLPSWELYEDWERSRSIPMLPGKRRTFTRWNKPVQFSPNPMGTPDERVQYRRKQRNPDKFKVERGAQFATVQDAYLNEVMVDRMFLQPEWREQPVAEVDRGKFSILYRAHADPSRTNANFGFCIGHTEDAPPDEYGYVWPHVIIDKLKVWKPEDYPDHTIDYVLIGEELDGYLTRFPSIKTMSYDQFNSAGFIAQQKRKFTNIRVLEKTFTVKENQDRFEKFKSALNLGWVHAYRDTFAEEGQSLLELELKFLQEKNGKVDRQEIGPVQTKDLADAMMVVTTSLLHDSLDRWYKALNRTSVGSTNVAGLRSGREQERQHIFDSSSETSSYADPLTRYFASQAEKDDRRMAHAERNKATLQRNKLERARRNAFGSRTPYQGDRTRGRF